MQYNKLISNRWLCKNDLAQECLWSSVRRFAECLCPAVTPLTLKVYTLLQKTHPSFTITHMENVLDRAVELINQLWGVFHLISIWILGIPEWSQCSVLALYRTISSRSCLLRLINTSAVTIFCIWKNMCEATGEISVLTLRFSEDRNITSVKRIFWICWMRRLIMRMFHINNIYYKK